jgi:predicted MFS family arabinose efflux permease
MVSGARGRSAWQAVHTRISRPIGWVLLIAGVAVWFAMAVAAWFANRELSLEWLSISAIAIGVALAVVAWFSNRELTLEWLSLSAIAIGAALLLMGVGYEQYREWKETRYKDIQR